jgi:hypothetical protein
MLVVEGIGDALAEVLGRLVTTSPLDHDSELGLEVEGLETGRAVVDVLLDQDALLVGELAVEIVVHEVERFLTLVVAVTH